MIARATQRLLGRIAVAILDRAAGGAVAPADDRVQLAEQALDHAALVHATSVAVSDRHAVFGAASPERGCSELFRRIRHDLPRPSERWPSMRNAARFEPRLLAANGVGEAERDGKGARRFERETETEDAARKHVDENGEIGAADEGAGSVDDLHELDIGRRVVDLRHGEGPRRADVSGARLKPTQMFGIGRAPLGDFFRGKQRGGASANRDIGRWPQTGLLATRPDLADDRRQRRRLGDQPLLS
jgi:hypothetical protein